MCRVRTRSKREASSQNLTRKTSHMLNILYNFLNGFELISKMTRGTSQSAEIRRSAEKSHVCSKKIQESPADLLRIPSKQIQESPTDPTRIPSANPQRIPLADPRRIPPVDSRRTLLADQRISPQIQEFLYQIRLPL